MSVCDDLIWFNEPDEWVRIVDISRQATLINEDNHIPIPAFDLGVSIDNSYVAVIATGVEVKVNWRYAGELRQSFPFPSGGGGSAPGQVQSAPTPLFINKLQIVKMENITLGNYRLRYQPPAWFRDCAIRVYRYTGVKENFVKDTLFDVGNILGIEDLVNPDAEHVTLRQLYEELQACCDYYKAEIAQIKEGLGTDFNEVFRLLAEIKAIRVGDASSNRTPSQSIALSYFTNLL